MRRGLAGLGSRREEIEAILHGDPLGHPLHVMLTDVPLGAWTTAVVCDALGLVTKGETWPAAARAAVGVGLAGALAAAAPGLADWSRISSGPARRVGLVHAALNVGVIGLFVASLARRPERGRGSALAGYALLLVSARLGGELVYRYGVGVAAPAVAAEEDRAA
ncbi:MAG: DUF2231 domain-containing protein [Terriglobales bacterium]